MIRRPDEYAHQNDSNAIVDELNVRGGRRVVADLNELYALGSVIDKLQNEVTIVRVISEDKDFRLVDKNNVSNANGWTVNTACALPEIQVSVEEPVDENIILWGKLPTPVGMTDLDILRQIRDSNPTSQLPSLWSEDKDPYTQWEGVTWNGEIVTLLDVNSRQVLTLQNVNKLSNLTYLNCMWNSLTTLNVSNLNNLDILFCQRNQLTILNTTGAYKLRMLDCNANLLSLIDLTGMARLELINCSFNQLSSISSLTLKGNITNYNFTYNNFTTAELNRLRSMWFIDESRLLPQNI